jgi:hypothetical protein
MARWTAHTTVAGPPDDVLDLLTEPDAIARWAPIDFDVVDWAGDRLAAGDRVRVRGRLGGRALAFDVDVAKAEAGDLRLTAQGPIRLDVEYRVRGTACGSELHAIVDVSGRGIMGRVLAQATDALLATGALRFAVDRLAGELPAALVAA